MTGAGTYPHDLSSTRSARSSGNTPTGACTCLPAPMHRRWLRLRSRSDKHRLSRHLLRCVRLGSSQRCTDRDAGRPRIAATSAGVRAVTFVLFNDEAF